MAPTLPLLWPASPNMDMEEGFSNNPSGPIKMARLESSKLDTAPAFATASTVQEVAESWEDTPTGDTPLRFRTRPPTIEEIEKMERLDAMQKVNQGLSKGETEEYPTPLPSSTSSSNNSKKGPRPYSRQVSRISGTGRVGLQQQQHTGATPKSAPSLHLPFHDRPDRSPHHLTAPNADHSLKNRNFNRRSVSSDDLNHNHPLPRGVRAPMSARKTSDQTGYFPSVVADRRQPAMRVAPPSAAVPDDNNNTHHKSPAGTGRFALQRETRSSARRAHYTAHGTPPAWRNTSEHPERHQPIPSRPFSGSCAAMPRRNSAPDFAKATQPRPPVDSSELSMSSYDSSVESPTFEEGGHTPIRSSTTRSASARALTSSGKYDSKYPSDDRESFARTLNDEELDEVWKCLGEGVSQRGCESEVAYEGRLGPSSPGGTSVSGAFPMLTATVLQRHERLVVGDRGGPMPQENVMPMPKQLRDKSAQDIEKGNGTRSSSKRRSTGSSRVGQSSSLTVILSYVVLVLSIADIVVNSIFSWDVLLEHPLWALFFVPGVLGILLFFSFCRNSHGRCRHGPDKDEREEVEEERRGPHPCAILANMILLVVVVLALGIHASVKLSCDNQVDLFIPESSLEPLCGKGPLLLPIVLSALLFSVASLRVSRLCWTWVLA